MPGSRPPPSHTALAALPAIALDLETTGLDVANDRIVQVGAVAMRGPVILDEPRLDTRVDPEVPIPAASTRIHGIADSGVAGAPKLAELFEPLAEMLAGCVVIGQSILLDEAGVRRCRGGIMASNPQWRGTAEAWRERVAGWLRRSTPDDLLHVDIFYDLAPVAGAAGLGRELHAVALDAARRSPVFLALLAESVAAMSPPVGLFGRLRAIDGRVDLKMGGLLPLVGAARTLALRIGSQARSTPERIQDASAAGRVSSSDAQTLVRIHRTLLTLILEQQLEDLAAGVPPGSRIEVRRLSRADQSSLAGDLRVLDDTLKVLRSSIAG